MNVRFLSGTIPVYLLLSALTSSHAAELAAYVPSGGKPASNPIAAEFQSPMVNAQPIQNIAIKTDAQPAMLSSSLSGPVRDSYGSWPMDSGAWLCACTNHDGENNQATHERHYFGITLSAKAAAKLKLGTLSFEYAVGQNADVSPQQGNFYYAVFAKADGGAFQQIGQTFDSGKLTLKPNTSTLLGTQNIDLSKFNNASTIELRIWVGSTLNASPACSLFQNITVHGSAVN